jgi:hypothetical protein
MPSDPPPSRPAARFPHPKSGLTSTRALDKLFEKGAGETSLISSYLPHFGSYRSLTREFWHNSVPKKGLKIGFVSKQLLCF